MALLVFIARRALIALLTLFVVTVAIFTSVRMIPGDFVTVLLGTQATPEARALAIERYGLDQPILVQFATWLQLALGGDLGESVRSGQPVTQEIATRMGVTAGIAGLGALIAIVGGVMAGTLAGIRQFRQGSSPGAEFVNSTLLSLPDILLGSLFVYLISMYAVPFTVGKWASPFSDPGGYLLAAVPPALAVSVVGIGFVMASTRRAVTDVLSQPFVEASMRRGATLGQVLRWHLPRNIAVPVLTSATLYSAFLLGGAVIAEQIFSLNGLGRYIVDAIGQRDYNAVVGGVLVVSAVFIILNMLMDVIGGLIDPRVARAGGPT